MFLSGFIQLSSPKLAGIWTNNTNHINIHAKVNNPLENLNFASCWQLDKITDLNFKKYLNPLTGWQNRKKVKRRDFITIFISIGYQKAKEKKVNLKKRERKEK
jgi:hypothetical protein